MARPWTWNGYTLKTPSEYSWSFSDLSSEETGRSLTGTAYKDIISQKRSLDVTWWSLFDSGSGMTTVLFMSWVKSQVFGTLSFPSPDSAANTTGTFYTGDVNCTQYGIKNDIAEYKCSVSFIEQ